MRSLRILAITDIHYAQRAEVETVAHGAGRNHLAAEWLARAVRDACADGPVDVLALLGDFVEDGGAPGARDDLRELADVVTESELPFLVVPGNHDGDAEELFRLFEDRPGPHRVKGYTLYSFADVFRADDSCTRPEGDIEAFLTGLGEDPVIVLQHNPIFPEVDCSDYPFMPVNVEAIRDSYERAGVVLSLSGHYHLGQPTARLGGVTYVTCRALGDAPFCYSLITVSGRDVAVEERCLRMPEVSRLVDCHTHSHFGYCAEDVHPAGSLERADALGLAGVVCLEHAGQLYLEPDDFWHGRHVHDPKAIEAARGSESNRMGAFRKVMAEWRSRRLLVGLEVECDGEGKLNLLPEDRDGWDVLLGAVHWLPGNLPARTPSEVKAAFMWVVERMAEKGIDALAHPFRVLREAGLMRPTEMYRPLARLLKAHDAAAEVNCHGSLPDPEFLRVCAEEGTRLVLSSDAHRLEDVGDFRPHLRVLKAAGVPLDYVSSFPGD